MKRRQFLTGSLAIYAARGALGAGASSPRSGPHAGLQLYTVLDALEKDFEGTMRDVAAIGYREVETMGSFGRDPVYVNRILDRYGLVSPSQHAVSGALYDIVQLAARGLMPRSEARRTLAAAMTNTDVLRNVENSISIAAMLGQRNVVLPALWPEQMQGGGALAELTNALNRAGEKCATAGLTFSIHNHGDELLSVQGSTPYDTVVAATNPSTVKLEMDVYWMIWAKKSPIDYLRRYPNRYTQMHLKDARSDGTFAAMGAGTIDFAPILAAARRSGVQHYYLEQNSPTDSIAAARESYDYVESKLLR